MANANEKDVHLTIADKKIARSYLKKYFVSVCTYLSSDVSEVDALLFSNPTLVTWTKFYLLYILLIYLMFYRAERFYMFSGCPGTHVSGI